MERNRLAGWTLGVAALAATGGFTSALVGSAVAGTGTATQVEAAAPTGTSAESVLARLREAGYETVLELEREDGGYEAKVLDAQGRRLELRLDADGRPLAAVDHDDDRKRD